MDRCRRWTSLQRERIQAIQTAARLLAVVEDQLKQSFGLVVSPLAASPLVASPLVAYPLSASKDWLRFSGPLLQ